jgi:hypothetical protein
MTSSQSDRSRRLVPAALAAVVVLGGCVQQKPAGIKMQSLQADIVFAVAEDKAVPVPVAPVGQQGGEELPDELELPPFLEPTKRPRTLTTVPAKAKELCPAATTASVLEGEAPLDIPAPPIPGRYLERVVQKKVDGTSSTAFTQIAVTDVSKVNDSTRPNPSDTTHPIPVKEFTFKVAQPSETAGQIKVTSYKVLTGGYGLSVAAPVAGVPNLSATTGVPVENVPLPQSYGGGVPDRGLTITKVEELDATTGNTIGDPFQPATPVQLLPMTTIVNPGENFQSAGTDPTTGATMAVQGAILDRQEVDVCGKLVEGFKVTTNLAYSGPGTSPVQTSYEYVVLTGYGALLGTQQVIQADRNQTVLTLGSLTPVT